MSRENTRRIRLPLLLVAVAVAVAVAVEEANGAVAVVTLAAVPDEEKIILFCKLAFSCCLLGWSGNSWEEEEEEEMDWIGMTVALTDAKHTYGCATSTAMRPRRTLRGTWPLNFDLVSNIFNSCHIQSEGHI